MLRFCSISPPGLGVGGPVSWTTHARPRRPPRALPDRYCITKLARGPNRWRVRQECRWPQRGSVRRPATACVCSVIGLFVLRFCSISPPGLGVGGPVSWTTHARPRRPPRALPDRYCITKLARGPNRWRVRQECRWPQRGSVRRPATACVCSVIGLFVLRFCSISPPGLGVGGPVSWTTHARPRRPPRALPDRYCITKLARGPNRWRVRQECRWPQRGSVRRPATARG